MKEYLLVGIGGFLGSIARYSSSSYLLHFYPNSKFPWGTFFVNALGCLLIGIIAGITERLTSFNAEIRLACITGFLGGFTTFSAFGIETLQLIKSGELVTALLYVCLSIFSGVFLAYFGIKISGVI